MIIDNYLDKKIGETLLKEHEEEREEHISSGKLAASRLGWPVQWQILNYLGDTSKEFDEYTLRKFERGHQVEEWIVGHMDAVETQKAVEYLGCVGFVDAVIDSKDWDFKKGLIPHEVKSVTNMKYKRIVKEGQADHQHKLQATLYALGMGASHYAIDYVASDDFRISTFIYDVNDTAREVENVIKLYDKTIKEGIVPAFAPYNDKLKWQANKDYNNYPDWIELTQEECMQKLKTEFPDSYIKLTKGE